MEIRTATLQDVNEIIKIDNEYKFELQNKKI